jgi:hypothetical protein
MPAPAWRMCGGRFGWIPPELVTDLDPTAGLAEAGMVCDPDRPAVLIAEPHA